ncbi:MAG: hypothetical protein IPK91_13395 [Saprospiraceae bacterium]|nr:hypothetical protein [Saprospiraceae bacterium]MBK8298241.1 hypothetical protein [Saprospiraceae bacterium]
MSRHAAMKNGICAWGKSKCEAKVRWLFEWLCFSFAFAKDSQTALPKFLLSLLSASKFDSSTVALQLQLTDKYLRRAALHRKPKVKACFHYFTKVKHLTFSGMIASTMLLPVMFIVL